MIARKRKIYNKKHNHQRRCPNCGELLPGKPEQKSSRSAVCSDCQAVIDLINSRIARYAGR